MATVRRAWWTEGCRQKDKQEGGGEDKNEGRREQRYEASGETFSSIHSSYMACVLERLPLHLQCRLNQRPNGEGKRGSCALHVLKNN